MIAPTDDEFVDAFGVATEPVDEAWHRTVRVEDVMLSFNESEDWVRVIWFRSDEHVLDLTRESAVRLRVWSGRGESWAKVEFDGPMRGALEVRIHPEFRVHDYLLTN